MPRPRPRPQREPCDCLDCSDRVTSSTVGPQSGKGGPARQDPPPKSLLVYVANAACTLPDGSAALAEAETPHLDAVVRDGYSGLLAFQPVSPELEQLLAPPAGQPGGATLAERCVGWGRPLAALNNYLLAYLLRGPFFAGSWTCGWRCCPAGRRPRAWALLQAATVCAGWARLLGRRSLRRWRSASRPALERRT